MNGIEFERGVKRNIEIEYAESANCVILKFDKKQIVINKRELLNAIKKPVHSGQA